MLFEALGADKSPDNPVAHLSIVSGDADESRLDHNTLEFDQSG